MGMFLAELGARVIKIENPLTAGDVTRHWRLESESSRSSVSAYFSCVNWGKESIALDLTRNEHREIFFRLLERADIVIQNFKSGVATRRGLDYESLSTKNPKLIYAEISAYGSESTRVGFDAIVQAESGFTYLNGETNGMPVKMPVALVDLLAAHQIKEGILLALLRRTRTGKGSIVRASLLQSAVASLANQATNWLVAGVVPRRAGSEHPNIAPYGTIFQTADSQEIVLAVGTDRQFERLCEILSIDLSTHPEYLQNQDRVRNRTSLNTLLSGHIKKLDRDTLLEKFNLAEIPAGPVNTMEQVFELDEAQKALCSGTYSGGERITGVRSVAFEMEEMTSPQDLSPPPAFNQDGVRILIKDLGFAEPAALKVFAE